MADHDPNLDEHALRELAAARREHLASVHKIPLADKDLFAAACEAYERRVEAILHSAGQRPHNGNGQPEHSTGGRGDGEMQR